MVSAEVDEEDGVVRAKTVLAAAAATHTNGDLEPLGWQLSDRGGSLP